MPSNSAGMGTPAQPPEAPPADGYQPVAMATLSGTLSEEIDVAAQYMPPQLSMEPSLQPRISAAAPEGSHAAAATPQPATEAPGTQPSQPAQPAPSHVQFQPQSPDGQAVEMSNPAFWAPHAAHGADHAHQASSSTLGSSSAADEEQEDDLKQEILPLVSEKAMRPTEHKWNWWPVLLLLWLLGGAAYHYYIRITQLNGLYGLIILCLELVGMTSFLPYAILLTRGIYPTGSSGLPPAEEEDGYPTKPGPQGSLPQTISLKPAYTPSTGTLGDMGNLRTPFYEPGAAAHIFLSLNSSSSNAQAASKVLSSPSVSDSGVMGHRFHVRVLIPCYKEPLKVVAATVEAARDAALPANTRRTIYLCDDGKDPEKKALIETMGPDVVYVSGRKRKPGEINGKSHNLNHCLKNEIYKDTPRNEKGDIIWTEISHKELLVVFDADMCAKPEFFLRMLEVMTDDEMALVLSPQSFHNISPDADLFNNINKQFWECWLPGAFAWGYIACTGTNFCLRVRALAHCGWFPDYTITEDYALGMELKSRGYKADYLMLYLAVGEAPDEIRNVFRQRSRWTKGHFQVFFRWLTCPIFHPGLPFFQRLWYSYASWAPICTAITVPTFMVVPFMSIVFGYNPVTITFEFVLSSTIYYVALALVQNYSYSRKDWKLMWFANGSNTVLWFMFCKAFFNSILAKLGMKVVAFKVTEKVKPQTDATALAALQAQQSLLQRMASAMVPGRSAQRPHDQPLLTGGGSSNTLYSSAGSSVVSVSEQITGSPLRPAPTADSQVLHSVSGLPATPSTVAPQSTLATPLAPQNSSIPASSLHYPVRGAQQHNASGENKAKPGWERFKAVLRSFKPAHIKDFDEMFDPLVILVLFLFSAVTFGFGVWQTIVSISARAPASFALDSPLKGSPYLIVSTLWAFYNCIFPYLFLHYCITAGRSFKLTAKVLMVLSQLVMVGTMVLLWMLIPTQIDLRDPLKLQLTQYIPSQVLTSDTNTNITFVQGLGATPVSIRFDQDYINALQSRLAAANAQDRRRSLLTQPDDAFDPAALSDDELHADGPLAAWQRSLLQSSLTASTAAANLPPGLDLTGGLLVKDNVKYGQPMGYAITQLAWSLLQFPQGFTSSQKDAALQVIRSGADYLIRCMLATSDGRPVFVAQLGDARDYVAVQDMVQDPGAAGKIWTSPQQDPYLTGARPRKAWVLDENHVGADLLANVAAGLAAASMVLQDQAPAFSQLALDTAKEVYALASIGQPFVRPHSYCEFVPCQMNVTTRKDVLMVPVDSVPERPRAKEPVCYFIDWPSSLCLTLWTVEECAGLSRRQTEVFKNKGGCCSTLAGTGIWDDLETKAQGLCAMPENQYSCYIPDSSVRTCYERTVNNVTGWGCNGKGLEIFATDLACCNYLIAGKFIDADAGKPGAGLCARANIDVSFKECYVPSYSNATCLKKNGTDCVSFGARTSFSEPTACCNDLIPDLLAMGVNPQGICEFPKNATELPSSLLRNVPSASPSASTTTATTTVPAGTFLGRKLQQPGSQRALLQGASPPPPTGTGASTLHIDPDLLWEEPTVKTADDYVLACSTDDDCNLKPVLQNTTVTFYNSTSTLDDMAWGGVWLYRASKDYTYLGEAKRYLDRHYQEDINGQTLTADRSYYVSDWNNLAWATNALMLQLTGSQEYDVRLRSLLNAWLFGRTLKPFVSGLPAASSPVNVTAVNTPANYTDVATNVTYYVVPTCIATSNYESNCFDGVDEDCDGFVDREDVDCGLFPVVYTPKELAYSQDPSLPHAAAASWLGMVYAESQGSANARKLRCWALGQVAYMMGVSPDTRSYIVGYRDAPGVVRHMTSSCPAPNDDGSVPVCNWDNAFWPTVKNPQMDLLRGALVAGPDRKDQFTELRISSDTQVTLDGTLPLTGVLAGLLQTGTSLRSCELMHGLYQRLASEQEL